MIHELKTLNFGPAILYDGTDNTQVTEAVDVSRFKESLYLIVMIGNEGEDIAIDSVVLQHNTSMAVADEENWEDVEGGTFSRLNAADDYTFLASLFIPVDNLRKWIRLLITSTGTSSEPTVSIAVTGVGALQYSDNSDRYLPFVNITSYTVPTTLLNDLPELTITFESFGIPALKCEFLVDGVVDTVLETSVDPTSGEFTITSLPSADLDEAKYTIRLSPSQDTFPSSETALLTFSEPSLVLTAPTGESNFDNGDPMTITWDAFAVAGTLTIILLYEDVDEGVPIATGVNPALGTYEWGAISVLHLDEDKYKIRIEDDGALFSVSAAAFTVNT